MKIGAMKFSIMDFTLAIGLKQCIICKKDLEERYNTPICKEHRIEYLEELSSYSTSNKSTAQNNKDNSKTKIDEGNQSPSTT